VDITASLVIGGTAGLGREVAQHLADRGEQVLIAGRDGERAQRVAAEIGGQTSGLAMDLAESETIADALAGQSRIDHLVIASAEGFSSNVRDFNVAPWSQTRDTEACWLYRDRPRSRAAVHINRVGRPVRRPGDDAPISGIDDGHGGERRSIRTDPHPGQ